nr:MAG TPA: Protein of unknown function (DUF2577) [Caudoviricetes sp.]
MSDIRLVELIKKVAINAMQSTKPTGILYGTVKSIDPLIISYGNTDLPSEVIIVPKHLHPMKAQTVEEYPVQVEINNSLKEGDKVILMNESGFQKFVVVGVYSNAA